MPLSEMIEDKYVQPQTPQLRAVEALPLSHGASPVNERDMSLTKTFQGTSALAWL